MPETRTYQVRLQEEINQNREYKSSKPICATWSLLSQCTESKDHLCHYVDVKSIYAKRKETILRVLEMQKKRMVFVVLLKGIKKLSMQAILYNYFKSN